MVSRAVIVRRESVLLPTYEPLPPDKNPMFLERRVYQGSSGAVYPLPFYNRVAEIAHDRAWDAVHLENDFIRLMILPELGGRIHCAQDKSNGYELFYRQPVIKPALVGLAGPWASGGVEFNWPQHHRPATFMRVEVEVEEHADGSRTVWLSDHDPMARMKGMHGVCLHPDRAVIELKMRAYNRTPFVQSFLWWANVATHVHEGYQSFFPPDVTCVADHAKRAMSRFPLCEDRYYGIDYGRRARAGVPAEERPRHFVPPHCRTPAQAEGIPAYPPNDLSWYANIPVPTSYMCLGSKQDFSGGYDFKQRAGLVQIANHHIAPGKKQWTWGNHEFGYAWDRNLTDKAGPYIELMVGVYTDNQPDFSFLQPGETKTWSIFWYPIQAIGPVQAATVDAAVSLSIEPGQHAKLGVAVTRPTRAARIRLLRDGQPIFDRRTDMAPDRPFVDTVKLPRATRASELRLLVHDASGRECVAYQPIEPTRGPLPLPATEPPQPKDVASTDELYVIGLHLAQYRHATRSPTAYWGEALRRDPGDARCNHALGVWQLHRGEFTLAETFFRTAIARLTSRNPNPADGEPYYDLGVTLAYQERWEESYAAFYKATWNQAWQSAGFHALAEIDARRADWPKAIEHLERSLRLNADNLRARNLLVLALRQVNEPGRARAALGETLRLDPLDWWARHLRGDALRCDAQTRIDHAIDHARAGLYAKAIELLTRWPKEPLSGAAPLVHYYLAEFHARRGNRRASEAAARRALSVSPDYCFPKRLEDMQVLERAIRRNPKDARAHYLLGNFYYDRRRYDEAIESWERSAARAPEFPTVWRNLGLAYFNRRHDARKAQHAYDRAFACDPADPRLLYERDQLWKRCGVAVSRRLRVFRQHPELVQQRDDASIELCAMLNHVGRHADAQAILTTRKFQPWEGGEGQALGQYVRTHLAIGRTALRRSDHEAALRAFMAALRPPENLGEAKHFLANQSDIYYWLGQAHAAAGQVAEAKRWWTRAAATQGDFQEMSVRRYSEMTYFAARSLEKLGRRAAARKLVGKVLRYADALRTAEAKIDYFATSLPTMLLFEDDLTRRQETTALFLRAQCDHALGRPAASRRLLREILRRDPSHPFAADLLVEVTGART